MPLPSRDTSLVLLLGLAIVSAMLFSFYKFYYLKDFTLHIMAPCDSEKESCFMRDCEDSDVRCEGQAAISYKIVVKNARNASKCLASEACSPISCELNERDCEVFFCSDDTLSIFNLSDYCSK
jgi:hypothetical protein